MDNWVERRALDEIRLQQDAASFAAEVLNLFERCCESYVQRYQEPVSYGRSPLGAFWITDPINGDNLNVSFGRSPRPHISVGEAKYDIVLDNQTLAIQDGKRNLSADQFSELILKNVLQFTRLAKPPQ